MLQPKIVGEKTREIRDVRHQTIICSAIRLTNRFFFVMKSLIWTKTFDCIDSGMWVCQVSLVFILSPSACINKCFAHIHHTTIECSKYVFCFVFIFRFNT